MKHDYGFRGDYENGNCADHKGHGDLALLAIVGTVAAGIAVMLVARRFVYSKVSCYESVVLISIFMATMLLVLVLLFFECAVDGAIKIRPSISALWPSLSTPLQQSLRAVATMPLVVVITAYPCP